MFTSYFANIKNIVHPVLSISGKSPDWYDGREFKTLAPKREFFLAYKAGELDEAGYVREFKKQVLNNLDAKDVWSTIVRDYGRDVTLLCYERGGEFCHRRLVADWLYRKLGRVLPELSNVYQGDAIESFDGDFASLSNFQILKEHVVWHEFDYPTVEHAYQAAKCKDSAYRRKIRCAATPGNAKRLGQKAELRSDWEDVKISVMTKLIERKYSDYELAMKLACTGDAELIEGNWWGDSFWGRVTSKGFKKCVPYGENNLGKILMKRRDILMYGE